MSVQFGWIGPFAAASEWDLRFGRFPQFRIYGDSEVKRTCAWDNWAKLGWDINKSQLFKQEIGDCVSFGAAICIAAVAAHEIVRNGEFEQFKVPFAPYLYGIGRLMPEGGNGRLGSSDGSLGSWMAETVVKYGVLRDDYQGVPEYSGSVAKQWGTKKSALEPFLPEGEQHLIKTAARIRSIEDLAQAITNGYYCTIASNRGYNMQLRDDRGKSWFTGRDTWPHQMSLIAVDTEPELCFYRRNQWGTAHGRQLDGPDGGGWITAESLEPEIKASGTECFAYSTFIGFPSEQEKPRNYFA